MTDTIEATTQTTKRKAAGLEGMLLPELKMCIRDSSNLCLLCHHHHTLLEPARYPTRDQWEIRIAHDGIPEVIPPARYDPHRKPIRHARFHTNEPASQA